MSAYRGALEDPHQPAQPRHPAHCRSRQEVDGDADEKDSEGEENDIDPLPHTDSVLGQTLLGGQGGGRLVLVRLVTHNFLSFFHFGEVCCASLYTYIIEGLA